MPINYTPRLKKWFTVDETTKYYLDKDTFFYAAVYNGQDTNGVQDAINEGSVGITYLVMPHAAKTAILAPNPPFITGEGF